MARKILENEKQKKKEEDQPRFYACRAHLSLFKKRNHRLEIITSQLFESKRFIFRLQRLKTEKKKDF